MRASRFLFRWRWALSSEWGPKNPTDRHVALVLSLYMRSDGLGAWPSQTTLAARTGLTPRSVGPALQRLVKQKWLSRVTRKPRRGRAAKGQGFDYAARLPRQLSAMYATTNPEGASLFHGRDPFKPKRVRGRRRNTEVGDIQIPKQLPTNAVKEQNYLPTRKSFEVRAAAADVSDGDVAEMQRAFGEIP